MVRTGLQIVVRMTDLVERKCGRRLFGGPIVQYQTD